MQREPAVVILALAGLLNAVLVIAGHRLGLTELELGGLTTAVLGVATASVRARVTPVGSDEA
jgi:hypothetical protein